MTRFVKIGEDQFVNLKIVNSIWMYDYNSFFDKNGDAYHRLRIQFKDENCFYAIKKTDYQHFKKLLMSNEQIIPLHVYPGNLENKLDNKELMTYVEFEDYKKNMNKI